MVLVQLQNCLPHGPGNGWRVSSRSCDRGHGLLATWSFRAFLRAFRVWFAHKAGIFWRYSTYTFFQIFKHVILIKVVVAGKPRKSQGDYIRMMYVFSTLNFLDIEPYLVHQVDVFRLHGGCVRTNAVGFHRGVRTDKLEHKLPLWLQHGLPGLSQPEGLFFASHFAGEAGNNG